MQGKLRKIDSNPYNDLSKSKSEDVNTKHYPKS